MVRIDAKVVRPLMIKDFGGKDNLGRKGQVRKNFMLLSNTFLLNTPQTGGWGIAQNRTPRAVVELCAHQVCGTYRDSHFSKSSI